MSPVTSPAEAAGFILRPATPADVATVLRCIRALAEYERLLHECVATEELLRESLFGDQPAAEVVLAFDGNDVAGYALWFRSYSTFLARPGIYLEDLFVFPEHRRRGLGRRLLAFLAHTAVERRYGRVEWAVLDWNQSAMTFYRSLGAVPVEGWTVCRLTGDALPALAAQT
ncbi:MAG TPA: GNAT family N-acetyltransferase [Gemmatimonadaceae bacterium]|nr:GNAT family N-acetyltransferase [Gemmatimonadaceae bacterium]